MSFFAVHKLECFIETVSCESEKQFCLKVCKDIRHFLRDNNSKRYLIFPPFKSRFRFFVHSIGQILGTSSFSLGQEPLRFIVIVNEGNSNPKEEVDANMEQESLQKSTKNKRRGKRGDVALYVPPALRAQDGSKEIETNKDEPQEKQEEKDVSRPQELEDSVKCLERLAVSSPPHEANERSSRNAPKLSKSPPHETCNSVVDLRNQEEDGEEPLAGSWEDWYGEAGDFIEKNFITEVNKQKDVFGKKDIERAKQDYSDYMNIDKDLAHIVEIYGFPAELKTCDLMSIFDTYNRDNGFQIKWVDDTHALGVFSSAMAAVSALSIDHPLIKVRPVVSSGTGSLLKAREVLRAGLPVPLRPPTCVRTARRLVTSALGIRVVGSKEERDRERMLLSAAREKKRLAAKQQDDAWEGKFSSKP